MKVAFLIGLILGLAFPQTASAQPGKQQVAEADFPPVTEINRDTVLDPGKTYGRIVITASNIKIDGRGAKVAGINRGNPKTYKGIGIFAENVSHVTLTNVRVQGFETGLKIINGESWLVEGCDLSGNFHDPDFGWGEQGRRGGIVLERVRKSTFRKNTANQVWDACALVDCHDNQVLQNNFSKTSNTCLKLWTSTRNVIAKNDLSFGIRISPGEVHARDSTCVLLESGSNDNRLMDNNCTHGGDGIFVRVLNGWVSTGNHFEGNDCSYANNNGVECWAPRNVFVRNKANHSSYGFWMGGSDQSRLIENEASFNGELQGHHNSPHLPDAGHAGIVFMFGPSSHSIARGNVCRGNNGAGIAVIGDLDFAGKKWKAFHWIIEQNVLNENRWGIYLKHADWIDIGWNDLRDNRIHEIFNDGGVTRLKVTPATMRDEDFQTFKRLRGPTARLTGPTSCEVGAPVVFDATASSDPGSLPLTFQWDLGAGQVVTDAKFAHAFAAPGFYRVGLTVSNGTLSDLAWRDFYVVERLPEFATEGQASEWGFQEEQNLKVSFQDVRDAQLAGKSSVYALISPYHGQRATLRFPREKSANVMLTGKTHLVLWLKTINPNLGWQDVNPVITLYDADSHAVRLSPKRDLLGNPTFNEAREGWKYFEIPLAGNEDWQRDGVEISSLHHLTIGVDSWDAQPLQLWLDGLSFKTR